MSLGISYFQYIYRVTLTFHRCETKDLIPLQEISISTFQATYAAQNDPANFKKHLDRTFHTDQLLSEIRDANIQYYFAQLGDQIVGYVKLNVGGAQTESITQHGLEIERIYLRSEYHRQGLGAQMINFVLELARSKHFECVWLGVWEHNPSAVRFYEKMGFTKFGTHTFVLGDEDQLDYI